jgi:protein ImuB
MPVAEALALDSRLHVEQMNVELDRAALEELAGWSGRFSPIVALGCVERRHALLLDITGCAVCFGGEDRLLDRVVRELCEQGWNARVAIADTVGAAWAVAHYGAAPLLVPPGQLE